MTFLPLFSAELRKVRGRGLLAAVHLFAALHGVAAVALGLGARWVGQRVAGETPPDVLDLSVAAEVALDLAHLPVLGLVLLGTWAVVFAEDFALGTMANIVARPVRRTDVLAAKVCLALTTVATTSAIAVAVALLGGALFFGFDADHTQLQGNPSVGWMAEVPSLATRLVRVLLGLPLHVAAALPTVLICALLGAVSRSTLFTLFGALFILGTDLGLEAALTLAANIEWEGAERARQFSEWTMRASAGFVVAHEGGWDALKGVGPQASRTLVYAVIFGALAAPVWAKRDIP